MKIELTNDYFVEVDELNHTLKKRYIGKDKDNNDREAEKIIGYFSNLPSCVERLARLLSIEKGQDISDIKEYAKIVEDTFKELSGMEFKVTK